MREHTRPRRRPRVRGDDSSAPRPSAYIRPPKPLPSTPSPLPHIQKPPWPLPRATEPLPTSLCRHGRRRAPLESEHPRSPPLLLPPQEAPIHTPEPLEPSPSSSGGCWPRAPSVPVATVPHVLTPSRLSRPRSPCSPQTGAATPAELAHRSSEAGDGRSRPDEPLRRRPPSGPWASAGEAKTTLTPSMGPAYRPLCADRAGLLMWLSGGVLPGVRLRLTKAQSVSSSGENAFSLLENVFSKKGRSVFPAEGLFVMILLQIGPWQKTLITFCSQLRLSPLRERSDSRVSFRKLLALCPGDFFHPRQATKPTCIIRM
ncbi:extensin-like [Triticum aestivum]|uniref:extensin-like n=1 Tax=Triticum aestivum TaxID=4565 RepID=UPI001D034817|nr:extensin-like [Triticum aestivum]